VARITCLCPFGPHFACKIDLIEALPLLSIDSFLNTFSELLTVRNAGTFSFDVLNALDPIAKPHMSVLACTTTRGEIPAQSTPTSRGNVLQ